MTRIIKGLTTVQMVRPILFQEYQMGKRADRRRHDKTKRLSPASVPIVPRNDLQADVLKAFEISDQVFLLGDAGVGKTFLSTAYAANQLAIGNIQKIILLRPAVSAGENHGYLPGDLADKLAPWAAPFMDVLEERMSKEGVIRAREAGAIEVAAVGLMRGRTLNNALVLVDEAQNCTYEQLKMLATRVGENSKLFIFGDHTQSDLGSRSGLPAFAEMARRGGLPVFEFQPEHVVRSAICQFWTEQTRKWEAVRAS